MHIAFVSLGAFGHVNPTLSLVTELVKRKVRVTYFSTENFRTIVEPTGANFVAVPSWMAQQAGQQKGGADEDVGATVPFLFLNEAGGCIDSILEVLKADRSDAIVHDFAGIAGTIAADALHVPNVMLYTSYPSNDSYSMAASFESVPADHPLRKAADQIAEGFVQKYGCRKMTVKEIFDGHGDFNLVMMQKRLVPHNETFEEVFDGHGDFNLVMMQKKLVPNNETFGDDFVRNMTEEKFKKINDVTERIAYLEAYGHFGEFYNNDLVPLRGHAYGLEKREQVGSAVKELLRKAVSLSGAGGETVRVYDLNGRTVLEIPAYGGQVIDLPAGNYVLSVGDQSLKVRI